MKRIVLYILFVCLFCGCTDNKPQNNSALELRAKMQSAKACSFDSVVTADYGDSFCSFTLHNEIQDKVNLRFTVLAPDSISGVSGYIAQEGGRITFDDQVLLFQLLLDQELTPIGAPWLLYKTLVGGVVGGVGRTGDDEQVIYDDVYDGAPYQMYVTFDPSGFPTLCEFVWNGRRFLTVEVKNFEIL